MKPNNYLKSLPFGLKQKPLNHYFENGLIRFSIKEGVLFYKCIMITKPTIILPGANTTLIIDKVMSKTHLEKLLSIKSVYEIPLIEEVVS